MDRRPLATWVGLAMVLASLGACAAVEQLPAAELFGSTGPKAVVGQTLAAIADHDLQAANGHVCDGMRNAEGLPIPLSFRIGTARLPDVTDAEVLSVVDLDFSGLKAVEIPQDETQATVEVRGPVGLRFDVPAVRALAERATNGTDPATVDTVMYIIGEGTFTTSMHASMWLTKDSGRWLICSAGEVGVGG